MQTSLLLETYYYHETISIYYVALAAYSARTYQHRTSSPHDGRFEVENDHFATQERQNQNLKDICGITSIIGKLLNKDR